MVLIIPTVWVSTCCKGRKKRLSVLFIIEALFLLIGVIFAFLPRTKEDIQNTVAISSVIASVVLLIIADIEDEVGLYSLLKVIHYFSNRGTSNVDFPSLQTSLLVYILALSLFKISTIKAVVFLLFNMTPPKKAS
ncbi:hypothetical protein P8452_04655 [Trifolium repens]|nr:hypothetical protein P8452_04655 [Trifolium repens]